MDRSRNKPSLTLNLIRAFWAGVAILHAFLFARRLFSGDWVTGLAQVRLVLAMAGAFYGLYASVAFERMAAKTFDSRGKVLAFALLVLLGHVAVSPGGGALAREAAGGAPSATVVILALPAMLALTFGLGLLAVQRTSGFRRPRAMARIRPMDPARPRSRAPANPFSPRPPPSRL